MSIEIRRVLKYPPECFMLAVPVDLVPGENKVGEYVGFEPYILSLHGFSFLRRDGVLFRVHADGVSDVVRLSDLGSTRGLDYEEVIKIPVARTAMLLISTPTAISAYQWRYKVTVFRPTVAMKLQLGLTLSSEEERIARKFGLWDILKTQVPTQFNLLSGIEEFKTQTVRMTSSGTLLRVTVPKGRKLILTGVSTIRPTSPTAGYVNVIRDDIDKTLYLNPYCLPGLEYDAYVRVVALDKIEVIWEQLESGTYYFRITYGLGRLTIPEKIAYGLDLSSEERRIAEEYDLYDKVLAGVV